ncbi:hypothetical protein Scep_012812 [Stephania cephalantha]|uniref:Uncharacterized protein n=1 Tax=Stephania cephalantha TaxID=152367 RepID=A0AAP0P7Y1_9MAGN
MNVSALAKSSCPVRVPSIISSSTSSSSSSSQYLSLLPSSASPSPPPMKKRLGIEGHLRTLSTVALTVTIFSETDLSIVFGVCFF